ncbi:MAG: hypothetical protein IJ604_14655 [Prevotella sp.]|nr:hypothetical protein [Prevotella sp.]
MLKPITIKDNSQRPLTEREMVHLDNLKKIAGRSIAQLCSDDHPNLLVFPQSLGEYGDKIGDGYILQVDENCISTGNIMGFIGYRNTKVRIMSRFAQEDSRDYFLHYILQKVFAINLFDLKYNADKESIFDFLIYLFPSFLKRALRQGLYKEYQTRRYNDANVRGRIDVSRHIRQNIPFAGRVAYSTREYVYDNHVSQLIRHTIEYVFRHPYSGGILHSDEATTEAVTQIKEATPTYNRQDLHRVVNQNLRPLSHPYYSEYRNLQRLCLQILRHEELKYGRDDDEIYGILFDGAWLWEEYLNTILESCGFVHPQNKVFKGRIHLFTDGSCPRYPDFYRNDFVLDAKYKGYGNTEIQSVSGDDLHQVIAYMYRLKARRGGFVVPLRKEEQTTSCKELAGYGGSMGIYGLHTEHTCESFAEFALKMKEEEVTLKQQIKNDTL